MEGRPLAFDIAVMMHNVNTGNPSQPGQEPRTADGRAALHPLVFAFKLAIVVGSSLLLAGCTARSYRASVDRNAHAIIAEKQESALGRTEEFSVVNPADELRQRLLLDQDLPYTSPASLSSRYLQPTDHWPNDEYPGPADSIAISAASTVSESVQLGLLDALQVAARNNRQFQSNKEQVFRSALSLDLERNRFRTTFAGTLQGSYNYDRSGLRDADGEIEESIGAGGTLSAAQRLGGGALMTLQLGYDVIRLLQPSRFLAESVFGDASISVPLLRGAGRHIVLEPLTQAERDVIYAIYGFETFKRAFAVQIAAQYFAVLQRQNEVMNAEENYRGLIASTRRARRMLDAGRLPAIQVDQSIQNELSARNRWVGARESFIAAIDSFKILLGLPADAAITLDPDEFERLSAEVREVIRGAIATDHDGDIPPADAEIILEEPTMEDAGPLELPPEEAIRIALENRLDLRVAEGRVFDAQRQVVVAADRLRPEATLLGNARWTGDDIFDLRLRNGQYQALLNLDLPLERTAEAIAYRTSYLNLEQSVRSLQELEDDIKLAVLDRLRNLREARESLRIQALSVELAQRRVRGATLNLQAGRVQIRDLLEAQEDLLGAQNSLTAATVNYRVAELQMQRDLGILEVGPDGLWQESHPNRNHDETAIH
jgi:outer membrane protein TolC